MAAMEPDGSRLSGQAISEYTASFRPGIQMLAAGIVLLLGGIGLAVTAYHQSGGAAVAVSVICALVLLAWLVFQM